MPHCHHLLFKTRSSHIFTSSPYPLDVVMCPLAFFFFFFNRDVPLAITPGLAGGKEADTTERLN